MSIAVSNPNAQVIIGLRQIADLLEAHPELPEAYFAAVSLRPEFSKTTNAREVLTALAAALGDAAEESRHGSTVRIGARLADADIYASASVRDLTNTPPEPKDYEPIIPPREVDADEAWR